MIVFPNAKINIGLNVIEKRKDGYHNLESCFYPIPWKDALEVVEANEFSFNSSGIAIPGDRNIVVSAYELLKQHHDLPAIAIHLHKNIPMGAGLGGGSANGAFMLKLLNEKFSLQLSPQKLRTFAKELGSDCPFFIDNEPRFVEGTGDILSKINLDLSDLHIAIVYPDIHMGTIQAYKKLTPTKPNHILKEVIETTEISTWKGIVNNDFEAGVGQAILELKNQLYEFGALYASMSGSGSAVYGLFTKKPDIDQIPGYKFVSTL